MGCGPIEYLNISSKAGAALAAAKQAGAEKIAPYEYTAAAAYLAKAREEAGYSQYAESIEFGRHAEVLASRAFALARAHEDPGTGPAGDELGVVPAAITASPRSSDEPAAPPRSPAAPSRARGTGVDDEQPKNR